MGWITKGAMTICGTCDWMVELETSHKKDLNCTHGCFPVDDLVHVEVVDASIYVLDANV